MMENKMSISMKKVLIVLAFLVLSSCAKEGLNVRIEQPGSDNFEVKFLFQVDGVKIYRFFDFGNYRYFSTGRGSFQSQDQKTGKSSYSDGVQDNP